MWTCGFTLCKGVPGYARVTVQRRNAGPVVVCPGACADCKKRVSTRVCQPIPFPALTQLKSPLNCVIASAAAVRSPAWCMRGELAAGPRGRGNLTLH